MAELLGVVAGGAGLASLSAQILAGGNKIKDIYRSYHEAPNRLKDLSDDMKVFAQYLQLLSKDLEQERSEIVDQCVGVCSRASAAVFAAIAKFETGIQKSKFKGRMHVALASKNIAQFCEDLERAKTSLALACDLYSAQRSKRRTDMLVDHQNRNTALILQSHHSMIMEARQFHALILERLDRQTTTMVTRSVSETSLIDEDFSSPSTARQLKRVQHGRLRTTLDPVNQKQQRTRKTRWENGSYRSLRVRLSPWFTTRAWEISLNFGITMRTSNLISRDSMIFEACRDGDMREVLALFQTGQASPYDYCQRDKHWPEGMSVLGAAAKSGNRQLCRYLIDVAGFPTCFSDTENPLNAYIRCRLGSAIDIGEAIEMYRMLLEQPELDVDCLTSKTKFYPWWYSCPDHTIVRLIRDMFSASFSQMRWETQFEIALDNCGHSRTDMPQMFLEMLGYTYVDSRIAQACNEFGLTALHLVPEQLCRRRSEHTPSIWVDFVGQLLMHGADIHRRTKRGHTPLTWLWHFTDRFDDLTASVRGWIRLLHAIGIDLVKYGRVERRLWCQSKASISRDEFRIRDWTYGPCVDDWTVDSVYIQRIPIYVLEYTPGRWPENDQYITRTICWQPMQEDLPKEAECWSHERDVELELKNTPQANQHHDDYLAGTIELETTHSQDDCGAVMRLIQNTFRARVRPRSCSQPTKLVSYSWHNDQAWLPASHVCTRDGQVKFTHPVEEPSCNRNCHVECSASGFDYHESIKRQMRRFQTRYRNTSELKDLPYAAYHPTWRRKFIPEPERV